MSNHKTEFIYRSSTIRTLIVLVAVICVGLVLTDFIIHRHVHFRYEAVVGFYAWVGFISYLFIVLSAKGLRKLIKRNSDYYDD